MQPGTLPSLHCILCRECAAAGAILCTKNTDLKTEKSVVCLYVYKRSELPRDAVRRDGRIVPGTRRQGTPLGDNTSLTGNNPTRAGRVSPLL